MIYARTNVTLALTSAGLALAAFTDQGPPFVFSVPAVFIAVVALARSISGLMFGTATACCGRDT